MRPSPYATPGSIAPAHSKQPDSSVESKDIWNTDEISGNQQYEYDDPRPQPQYDIIFKQSVGTEDVFLGMGAKNPATSSCENMVVSMPLLHPI